uniref:HalX domain-containing protein n=1 Tax=viral metagenome TaxID=1070528 RepID=A0A6M3J415_9ZZZZ
MPLGPPGEMEAEEEYQQLQAEVNRLRGIIDEAMNRIDLDWDWECGDSLANIRFILDGAQQRGLNNA